MKRFLRFIVDKTLLKLVTYLNKFSEKRYTVLDELDRRTAAECADYVCAHMQTALAFPTRQQLWEHALTKTSSEGLIAEFGVWKGESINYLSKRIARTVFGFDSFEGLKEDWGGTQYIKGAFNVDGRLPKVAANVQLIKGWFDQTLPPFLQKEKGSFAYIHIDCDTYPATKTVLELLGPRMRAGTVIVFDEYIGNHNWRLGEFKAWQEFVKARNVEYEYLGYSVWTTSLIIKKINSIESEIKR